MALDVGKERADWVALLDDDIEPSPTWLAALAATQRMSGAPFVVGPRRFQLAPSAPAWFTDAFFPGIDLPEGAEMEFGNTANLLIASAWLSANPHVRFDSRYGVTGGEDMVFMADAMSAGAKVVFSPHALVTERYPAERCTVRYVLRGSFWIGNNMYLINLHTNASSKRRVVLRGCKKVTTGALNPIRRGLRGQRPLLMLSLSEIVTGLGMISGVFGLRVAHK